MQNKEDWIISLALRQRVLMRLTKLNFHRTNASFVKMLQQRAVLAQHNFFS